MLESGSAGGLDVSIALATYNGGAHILQQLESLAAQTLLPREVVITDDGSTDSTLEIVAHFAQNAPFPIRLYQNKNRLLYADNFLHAASLCTAPLIAFCDQDDIWSPEKLETSVPFFANPDVLLSAHTAEVWDGETVAGTLYPYFSETKVHSPLTLDPFELVPGFVIVVRRGLLAVTANDRRLRNIFTVGQEAGPMAHDQWVWFLATLLGKVATIAEPQALYRQHAANVVGAPKKSGWLYDLTLALHDVDYAGLAELESDAIRRVEEIAEEGTSGEKQHCRDAIGRVDQRRQYHEARALIYDGRSSVFRRVRAFARILRSGGYQDDKARYHLGRRAAVKDALFGVTGLHGMNGGRAPQRAE